MLKELFESQFYCTFPKIKDKVLMIEERVECGDFSIIDRKACVGCKHVCGIEQGTREQLKVTSTQPVYIVNMEQVFSYVQEDLGEVCDIMMEGVNSSILVEMSCSTIDYAVIKRPKARRQLYNSLEKMYTCASVKTHIQNKLVRYVIFSWKETFPDDTDLDAVEKSMRDMTIMAEVVYSPDNESAFDFGFKLKEMRYPDVLVCN